MDKRIPWEELSRELLEKYGGQAPRYTSYPTAPEWSDDFGPAEYARALAEADRHASEPLSVYVHIPYCKKRCRFCGCASEVSDDPHRYDRYLDGVEQELRAITTQMTHRRRVSQVHLGGGTPTVLNGSQLTRLMSFLRESLDLCHPEEVAIESAPGVTTEAQIDVLADLGFNRISFGVQDFTPAVQRAVDRIQSEDHTRALVARARRRGFGGINIDLMYGLPLQTLPTFEESLRTVVDISPDRIAVFGYAHVPWMRPHQRDLEGYGLPDTAARLALFRLAHDTLLDAGYVYIGMDHFAKPDDTLVKAQETGRLSRNFQGYTVKQAAALIGLGATAISDTGAAFAQNHPNTDTYLSCSDGYALATRRGRRTSPEDRLRRSVITELMCNLRVDARAISKAFGIDFWTHFETEKPILEELSEDGLVALGVDGIEVTPRGRMFVRHVGMAFDVYVARKRENGPRFSRTV